MAIQNRPFRKKLILFFAYGFGTGCIPVAPGTFGTIVGFGWVYLLLLPRNLWIYLLGIALGFFAAVWIGGRAEEILKIKDPGSIVIDEIAAVPLAFLAPVILFSKGASTPPLTYYFQANLWLLPVFTFVLFRLFDVTKPLFVGRSQNIKGGWGLVIDDFLAAALVVPCLGIYCLFQSH